MTCELVGKVGWWHWLFSAPWWLFSLFQMCEWYVYGIPKGWLWVRKESIEECRKGLHVWVIEIVDANGCTISCTVALRHMCATSLVTVFYSCSLYLSILWGATMAESLFLALHRPPNTHIERQSATLAARIIDSISCHQDALMEAFHRVLVCGRWLALRMNCLLRWSWFGF